MMSDRKLPGYKGDLEPSCVTVAEVLRPAGYRNYCVGKWHVTRFVKAEESQHNWPLQRGFDRFYGTLNGANNFFDPAMLARDNKAISPFADPEYRPEGEYYYTDAISDNAVKFVRDHREKTPDKPFFMYVAYTAAHWPMHALPGDIAKYKGKFDAGYEAIRREKFRKMKSLGLLSEQDTLPPPEEQWSDVQRKDWETACMEVYAAMIDRMDQGIGRIVGELKRTGQWDNTVMMFLQDNGACAETNGRTAREDYRTRVDRPVYDPIPLDTPRQEQSDRIQTREGYPVLGGQDVFPGPKDTFIAYGRGWANVSNTPFREYKHWVHEGGISTPLIIHAPGRIAEERKGELYREYGQLIDIMATCIDLADARYPKKRNDIDVTPLSGVSLAPALSGRSLDRTLPLFWEHEGNRAIRDGKWKLVSKGHQSPWELYDIEADRTELNDLATKHPERVERMAGQWNEWAVRCNVLPWPWDRKPSKKATASPAKP